MATTPTGTPSASAVTAAWTRKRVRQRPKLSPVITRLQTLGFDELMVRVGHDVRFTARKPAASSHAR